MPKTPIEYCQTPEYKESQRKYRQTPEYKEYQRKYYQKKKAEKQQQRGQGQSSLFEFVKRRS
jgi:hypothetical protein